MLIENNKDRATNSGSPVRYKELLRNYPLIRRFLPLFLQTITFHATPTVQPILAAWNFYIFLKPTKIAIKYVIIINFAKSTHYDNIVIWPNMVCLLQFLFQYYIYPPFTNCVFL